MFSGVLNNFIIIVKKPGYQKTVIRLLVKSNGTTPTTTTTTSVRRELQLSVLDEEVFIGQEFTVRVTDAKAQPVSETTVKYGSQQATTNPQGEAILVGEKNVVRITALKGSQTITTTIIPKKKQKLNSDTEDKDSTPDKRFDFSIFLWAAIGAISITIILRAYRAVRRRARE